MSKQCKIMNFKEYRIQTQRTLPNLNEIYNIKSNISNKPRPKVIFDSLHMTIGMCSEFHELISSFKNDDIINLKEEIGDILWYISNYMNVNNIDDYVGFGYSNLLKTLPYDIASTAPKEFIDLINRLQDHPEKRHDFIDYDILVFCCTYLLELDKKTYVYGKHDNNSINIKNIMSNNCLIACHNLCELLELSTMDIMKANIKKLYARYPLKFNEKDAIIRDIIREYTEMEKAYDNEKTTKKE